MDTTPRRLIGDKAYDDDGLDARLRRRRVKMISPRRSNRMRRATQDGREFVGNLGDTTALIQPDSAWSSRISLGWVKDGDLTAKPTPSPRVRTFRFGRSGPQFRRLIERYPDKVRHEEPKRKTEMNFLEVRTAEEMRVGPSDSDCRIRIQTTSCCFRLTA